MEYRRYRAETLREAKLKMLLDVGKRGYIIKQRSVKEGGFFGLFGKSMVEITVNVLSNGENIDYVSNSDYMDSDLNYGSKITKSDTRSSYACDGSASNTLTLNRNATGTETTQYMDSLERIKDIGLKMSSVKGTTTVRDKQESLDHEVRNFQNFISSGKKCPRNSLERTHSDMGKSLSKVEDKVVSMLKNYDFEIDIVKDYISLNKYRELVSDGVPEDSVIKAVVMDLLENQIRLTDGVDADIESGKKVLALIGPTGVGKTTTLAKLGAYYGILKGKRVKFVSADNYRVGAVQQLKIYSEIMEIPFSKVTSVEELSEEMEDNDYDVILIDTAGRSQKTKDDINEIKDYLDVFSEREISTSLVVSSTTKFRDLSEIIDKFSVINFNNVIVTKLDETNTFGQVLSAFLERNLRLSYVSFGQSVPEDLKISTKTNLLEILFN